MTWNGGTAATREGGGGAFLLGLSRRVWPRGRAAPGVAAVRPHFLYCGESLRERGDPQMRTTAARYAAPCARP